MVDSIKSVLMERDGMSEEEAKSLIQEAREGLFRRLYEGKDAHDICEEYFGLEPDYLDELMY